MAKKTESDPQDCSFEQNLEQLERILANLEKGEVPLEEQLKLFESGIALSRTCLQKLEAVEKKVEQLVVTAQGEADPKLETKPFDVPNEASS